MDQEIFKQNTIRLVVISSILTGIFLFLFIWNGDWPFGLLFLLIFPVALIYSGVKTKLVIEDDVLRYQMLIGSKEVSLKEVSQIITRELEIISTSNLGDFTQNTKQESVQNIRPGDERSTEVRVYLLDESNEAIFSFPAYLINPENQSRFEDTVTTINPRIKILFSVS